MGMVPSVLVQLPGPPYVIHNLYFKSTEAVPLNYLSLDDLVLIVEKAT